MKIKLPPSWEADPRIVKTLEALNHTIEFIPSKADVRVIDGARKHVVVVNATKVESAKNLDDMFSKLAGPI